MRMAHPRRVILCFSCCVTSMLLSYSFSDVSPPMELLVLSQTSHFTYDALVIIAAFFFIYIYNVSLSTQDTIF